MGRFVCNRGISDSLHLTTNSFVSAMRNQGWRLSRGTAKGREGFPCFRVVRRTHGRMRASAGWERRRCEWAGGALGRVIAIAIVVAGSWSQQWERTVG